MGIKSMPSYKDYWSSSEELRDNYISKAMSRNRFQWILSHLHFNDNTQQPKKGEAGYDKLYKIRPFLNILENTYKNSYLPHKSQAIDESMVKFKGRSSLRQYLPLKPIKRGYKVWLRADESGYICEFQIYTGRISEVSEKNLGSRVVKDLTKSLEGKFYTVYFDNFFNSVSLQRELLEKGIYACGTARKGRKHIPKEFEKKTKKQQRGDYDWLMTRDGILLVQWMDKKPVLFISNFHNPEQQTTVSRRKKDGTLENIPCPSIVVDYNKNMGFVDKADMLKKLYEVDRKSKKWYHRLVWYFVDMSILNAFVIFQERAASKSMTLKFFKIAVVSGLIGVGFERTPRGQKRKSESANAFKKHVPLEKRYDQAAHLPIRSGSLRCARCSTRDSPHRTKWKCSSCDVGLCLSDKKNCFFSYHNKSDF